MLRVQLHYQYQTISRGENSLFAKLRKKGIEPRQYILFCGLRQHALLNDTPVTELIYIHSKVKFKRDIINHFQLMIVDDIYAIMGSANVNDRSMLGSRDSEIAVLLILYLAIRLSLMILKQITTL